jgi:tetratricopeptide (TPR) repeat protein
VHDLHAAAGEESIGARVRRLRLERGLSQRELAEPGVSYAYVSRIEAGERRPSLKALRILARKLGVSLEHLETGAPLSSAHARELRLGQAELETRMGADPQAAATAFRQLLEDARTSADAWTETRARVGLALALARAGEHRQAVVHLERAIESEAVSPDLRPEAYAALGRSYVALGSLDRAVELFERCLSELADTAPDDDASAVRFASYLSRTLADRGDPAGSRAALAAAIERLRPEAPAEAQARIYRNLAQAAAEERRYLRALGYTRRANGLLEVADDVAELARALLHWGELSIANGQAEAAGEHLERAERLFELGATGRERGVLATLRAKRAAELGQVEETLERGREALKLLEKNEAEQGGAWHALGVAHALRGEIDEAGGCFRRAVDLLAASGDWREATKAARAWARALRGAGREAEAFDVMEQATLLTVRGMGAEARRNRS